jgi:renalase
VEVHDVVILGAGVSGLACARRLVKAGAETVILDRADKPGGRCATRWHEGTPFDYGPLFIHGSDAGFLAAAAEVTDGGVLEGWPRRVTGHGTPCQPRAFDPRERRIAFSAGLTAFPRSLAKALDVRLNTTVVSLGASHGSFIAQTRAGERIEARHAVMALALEQSTALAKTIGPDAANAVGLLEMFSSMPCLTVVAGYPKGIPAPDWDILYPERDQTLLLIGNESSKRPQTFGLTLVIQAGARWSRDNLERPKEEWGKELLAASARVIGPWATSPQWIHLHRWRHARLDGANALAAPLFLRLGKSCLGFAGDLFSSGGGMEAAWLSGNRLGEMMSNIDS